MIFNGNNFSFLLSEAMSETDLKYKILEHWSGDQENKEKVAVMTRLVFESREVCSEVRRLCCLLIMKMLVNKLKMPLELT